MTGYQIFTLIISLVGIPSLSSIIYWIYNKIKEGAKIKNAVRYGMQALLRAQMVNDYNKWSERGYAPIYARENFKNCWNQYHALGANGVMQDINDKFFALPTEPKRSDDDV